MSFQADRCDVLGFLCPEQVKSGGENELVSNLAPYNVIHAERLNLPETLLQPFVYKRHLVDDGISCVSGYRHPTVDRWMPCSWPTMVTLKPGPAWRDETIGLTHPAFQKIYHPLACIHFEFPLNGGMKARFFILLT
ncbi:MAG: hypothetical protein VCA36_10445, partial [Opitutales bacterium]